MQSTLRLLETQRATQRSCGLLSKLIIAGKIALTFAAALALLDFVHRWRVDVEPHKDWGNLCLATL